MPFWSRLTSAAPVAVPEQKSSATQSLVAMQQTGEPVWSPRDVASFAREGMMQNAVVYRCIRMIAEAAASVPLRLHAGLDEVTDHPLLPLLARPNQQQTATELLEAWYGHLLVAGDSYMEAVQIDGSVRELHVLRPDRMKLIPGDNGWPVAYDYCVAGHTVRFDQLATERPPILHHSLFHPANDHYGLSPIEAAATAIDIHNAASKWNKALLDNAARPSGALVFSSADTSLTAQQFERLKQELTDNFQGTRNAGRPLLLEGGLDWKSMAMSPRDMDFIEAKYVAAREIALALGVPPMLLGIPGDNTYSNYQEANRTFWRQTITPLVNKSARKLSTWLLADEAASFELRPMISKVEALRAERDELWKRVDDADFLTVNEKRAAVGFPPIAGGDQLAKPKSRTGGPLNA